MIKNKAEFYNQNYNILTKKEKIAWLVMFGLNEDIVLKDGQYYFGSALVPDEIDLNLIHQIESNLSGKVRDNYVENITNEISAITYRGMTDAQISLPSTTASYYYNLLHAGAELRAKCLYYSIRAEHV